MNNRDEHEFDLIDTLAFIWRRRVVTGSGLLLAIIASLTFSYLYKGKFVYSSGLEFSFTYTSPHMQQERLKKQVEAWTLQITEPLEFKRLYDIVESRKSGLLFQDDNVGLRQQKSEITPYPPIFELSYDEIGNKVYAKLNFQKELEVAQLEKIAELILSELAPKNNTETSTNKDQRARTEANDIAKEDVSYPGYEYARIEFRLFKMLRAAGVDFEPYMKMFNNVGPKIPGLDLLRLIATLEENKVITEKEAKNYVLSIYEKVPLLMISGAYATKKSAVEADQQPLEAIVLNERPQLQGYRIISSNQLNELDAKSRAMYRAIIFIGISLLGLVLAIVLEAVESNRERIHAIFAKPNVYASSNR